MEAFDPSERYRANFYAGAPPDLMTNQELISVLASMVRTIALLDQGVWDLVQTYDAIMIMMATSNNSFDEKISVINTIIGDKPPGLMEAYDSPEVWMTIAITSSIEDNKQDMVDLIKKTFHAEKDIQAIDILKQITTVLEARIANSELDLNKAMKIAKLNFQQGMMALKGTADLEGQKVDRLERTMHHTSAPAFMATPTSITGDIPRFIICSIKEGR